MIRIYGQLLLAFLSLQGLPACVSTTEWQGGLPRSGQQLKNETAKKAELKKYALHDYQSGLIEGAVQLEADAGTDTWYSLESYSPVLDHVEADNNSLVFNLKETPRYRIWGVVALLGALVVPRDTKEGLVASTFLATAGLGGLIAIPFYEQHVFKQIKASHARGLNQILFGPPRVDQEEDLEVDPDVDPTLRSQQPVHHGGRSWQIGIAWDF